ncbi:MAG: PEP-CTERM sorting domain-containing protein [Pirellulales bacterium]|nr:PEP-CTERM sorting domain-containing protein [Pirellulales bacterium]
MNRLIALLLAITAFIVIPIAASADPVITIPTDLNPGDTYRLVFVTSTTRNALSSNIADYNAFVAGVASGVPKLAALGTTWTAIASTSTVDARDNTDTNPSSAGVPIYRLDDTRIANDNGDLWDGGLLASLSITEAGTPSSSNNAWTGSGSDGVAGASSYLGTLSLFYADLGAPIAVNSHWIDASSAFPSGSYPLYGMSGVLTVVPEPSTLFLVCIGATAVVGCQLGRRRQRGRQ